MPNNVDEPSQTPTRRDSPHLEERVRIHRIEEQVVRRVLRRFWIVGALAVLLGYFGTKEIVRQVTEVDIRAAQRAAILAEESAQKAILATQAATNQVETYSATVAKLQGEANRVDAQFLEVKQRLDADSANLKASAIKDVANVTGRVARLEELVAKVAQESQASRQALELYRKDIERLKVAAEVDRRRFAENAQYSVTIYFSQATTDLARKAQQVLTEVGFKTATQDVKFLALLTGPFAATTRPLHPNITTIYYAPPAKAKAQEVKDLLAPLIRVKEVLERPPQQPVYVGEGLTWERIAFAGKPIDVYVVQKE